MQTYKPASNLRELIRFRAEQNAPFMPKTATKARDIIEIKHSKKSRHFNQNTFHIGSGTAATLLGAFAGFVPVLSLGISTIIAGTILMARNLDEKKQLEADALLLEILQS